MCQEGPKDIDDREWPEERGGGLFSRLTYTYMNRLLDKGAKQTPENGIRLNQEDLFKVPHSMESTELSRKFRTYFEENKDRKHRLIATLWKLAAPTFLPAGLWQMLAVFCQVGMPLIVRELLRILEDNPGQNVAEEGLGWAIGLFLVLALNGLANHRHRHLAMKSGVVLRASLINVLYEHVLHLTPRGRTGLTSGQVTNLVAVDTQKLFEVSQEAHLVWSLPLAVAVVTIFLVLIQGPTTLIGVGVLIGFVPLVERITSKMLKIRQKRAKMTDERIEIVSAMLQGIKVTKLNNYEENYQARIMAARNAELKLLGRELAVWGFTLVVTVISPILASAATFITYVLIDENNVLTTSDTFSVLLLFSALRFPVNYAGRLVGKGAQAFSALKRISAFLSREIREETFENTIETSGDRNSLLEITNGTFAVGTVDQSSEVNMVSETSFVVSGIDLTVKRGEVLGVVGPVAGGKSTFINGIIGEASRLGKTKVITRGKIAYVPQTPFILNATLRDNILFGQPFDKEHYERVIECCSLLPDIAQLGEAGDLTEIGERGVTLSGGQKQRVSLARAAYSKADILLLDDPLSALDAGTAKKVFEKLIQSRDSLFQDKAVVLVTHAAHFLSHIDRTLVIVEGKKAFVGDWESLLRFESKDASVMSAVNHIRSSVQDVVGEEADQIEREDSEDEMKGKTHKLMAVEERQHGLSSIRTWLLWFHHAGGFFFISLQATFMALDRFAYVSVEYWLSRWTDSVDTELEIMGIKFDPQTDGKSAQYKFILVYALIILISVFATVLRSEWVVTGGKRAASRVFSEMLASVLRAPMLYFETTPMGRVLNRFTFDVEVIDIRLTENMSILLVSMGWFITGIIVMTTILPYVALAIAPVTVVYWILLLHYRKSGADLQRLDALSRSPIQAKVSEGLEGSSTIRIFSKEKDFLSRYQGIVDMNSSALLNFITAQRWLGFRIELLGSVVVLTSSVLVTSLNEDLGLDAGLVGLLILWSSNFTITLGFLVDAFSEAEAAITAIERVDAMTRLPTEAEMESDSKTKPDNAWPSSGALEFRDVCMRYRKGLPLVLNNLSFKIRGGTRVGVVGRTGAGKSSLAVALFRLTEIESGEILLDGTALSKLGLKDVRGRPNGMAIIPQDPFLAGTTLRECVDPFSFSSDEDVLAALKSVRLAKSTDTSDRLKTKVEEGGANFSVGERQLLNLARALLTQPKVLVLDEATASVDGETDSLMQEMLRTKFKDTTLISVAHRLNTIMDYDMVLVMSDGQAVEFGPPSELLKNEKGVFTELVNATGSQGASALKKLVKNL